MKEYPSVRIVEIPGMAPSKRMIWTIEGNIALFEGKPGESTFIDSKFPRS
ncbi:MAG: hypothetical protein V1733_09480 [bacterium]